MSNRDYEYIKPACLADWLSEFAKRMQKNKKDDFDDIREIYKAEGGNFDTVEAKVREIRERAGLDSITKESSLKSLEAKVSYKKIANLVALADHLDSLGQFKLAEKIDARAEELASTLKTHKK